MAAKSTTKPKATRKRSPTQSGQATASPSGLPGRVVFEAFGDLVDPLEYLRDTPGWGSPNIATAWQASHRRSGQLAPAFDTEEALWQIQGAARIIAEVSPHAKCALNNLANYIVGKGFVYQVRDRAKIHKPDDPGSELAQAADAVVQEFLERHKWAVRLERELFRRAHRDGEYFLGLYHTGDGLAEARIIEPALVKKPQNVADIDEQYGDGDPSDWEFGVHTRADDIAQPLGYHVQWSDSPADFDYFTPERVAHCRVGVDANVKRGLSDFYAITDYLGDGAKLLRNAGKGAAVLAGIAAIIEHPPAVTGAQIESFRAGAAYSQQTETTPQGSRQKYTQQYGPATLMHVKNGQKYLPSPLASTGVGESVVKIEQAILRTAGVNWSMPEYMISGDASNANYSSTLVAESPFVKFCEAEQAVYCEEYRSILWLVLRIAFEAGQLPGAPRSFEELRRVLQIQVEPPRVAARNGLQESQQSQLLFEKGVLSIETWSAREGLDRKQELANGAKAVEPAPAPGLPAMESRDRLRVAAGLLWEGYPKPVTEEWSDEAREAAAEARRRNAKGPAVKMPKADKAQLTKDIRKEFERLELGDEWNIQLDGPNRILIAYAPGDGSWKSVRDPEMFLEELAKLTPPKRESDLSRPGYTRVNDDDVNNLSNAVNDILRKKRARYTPSLQEAPPNA